MTEPLPYLARINELPAYSPTEAARILGVPLTTIRAWIRGQLYMTQSGERLFRRVIVPAEPESNLLSFRNLIELYVLSSWRRIHGVALRKIREAIEKTGKTFNTQHPLSDLELLTDKTDLFIESLGEVLNLNRDGQIEMKAELLDCLLRVDKDATGIPQRLYPRRDRLHISVDPRVNFGRPSIVGLGVATEIVFERYHSGEDSSFLASDYRCEETLIQEAIDYERQSRDLAA